MLDPYREEMLDKNFNTFSFGGHLNFEAYVQYQEYCGFTKAMDTLRSMKLMLKGDDGKAVACNIKVLQFILQLLTKLDSFKVFVSANLTSLHLLHWQQCIHTTTGKSCKIADWHISAIRLCWSGSCSSFKTFYWNEN